MLKRFSIGLALVLALSFGLWAAQSAIKSPAITDPEKAGPDYQVQGEYTGTITDADGSTKPLGALVIALGKGAFRAVFLPGGLPGDGGDGKIRVEVPGQTRDETTTFGKPGSYSASHSAGQLTGQTDKGDKFSLKRIVRHSPTEAAKPPQGAIILFDGTSTDKFAAGAKMDDRHLLAAGATTRDSFRDFTLHLEFCIPFLPTSAGQGRGNSGVYIQRRYEVQILDSFGLPIAFNECASIYRQIAPSLNMSYPPLQWQTFDIDFQAPRWNESGQKTRNAIISVRHNGVLVHDKAEIKTKTGAGQVEGPAPGQINFQSHGNPVFFRNIWIVEK